MSAARCTKLVRWLPTVTLALFAAIPCTAGQESLLSSRGGHLRGVHNVNVGTPIEGGVQTQQRLAKEKSRGVWEQMIQFKLKEEAKKKKPEEGAGEELEAKAEAEEAMPELVPEEAPHGEEQVAEGEEKDTSAADISPKGEEMLKQMIMDEDEDDTPKVVKTPEELEREEKEEAERKAHETPDELAEAGKELFDKPAERKYGSHGHGDGELDEVFDVGEHDFGHSHVEDHSLHSELHHKDELLDQHVHFILLTTPVLVFTAVAYYFCISNIEIPPAMAMHSAMTDKMFYNLTGWRRRLGRIIENPVVNFTVLFCILIDLVCVTIHDLLHATDLLNPKYNDFKERMIHNTHTISIYLLIAFLVEQLLHIFVFGKMYFYHFWYVCDLVTVYVSLIGETVLNEMFGDIVSFLIVMRLWKVTNVVFDIFLASHETSELHEKVLKKKEKMLKTWQKQVTGGSAGSA
mmetsp:Transcript_5558/g.9893  ORF Transcript_5558/g.9893 Transcript_5558/m.9893 type:complete len:461 (+) Transcript_5558:88-1470(+)